jgi:hypothetical protein
VKGPEFDGWKKLSVEAIIWDKDSSAFDPARYVLLFDVPVPMRARGAER